jgi:hypothetical protein
MNLKEMLRQEQKMIEMLLQHRTELLEHRWSSTSDLKDTVNIALLEHYPGGTREWVIYLGSLQFNVQVNEPNFHKVTDKV